MFPVGEPEDVRQLLLGRGDAARIFAFQNVADLVRQREVPLFDDLAVLYDIHRDAGVDVAEDVEVDVDERVDLDDVLVTLFFYKYLKLTE